MKKITFLLVAIFCFFRSDVFAQCQPSQIQTYIQIETDQYGHEGYWELVPAGNPCGVGTIFSGGNLSQVGCNGANGRDATQGNGYNNNATITEGPWCLTLGADYDIIYIDDYNDGGFSFHIEIQGYEIGDFTSDQGVTRYTFTAQPPPQLDAAVTALRTPQFNIQQPTIIKGKLANTGRTTMNSAEINYQVDNQAIVSQTFTFLPVSYNKVYDFSFSTPFLPVDTGDYNLRVWVSEVNGQTDVVASNNEQSQTLTYSAPIPVIINDFFSNGYTDTLIADASDQVNIPRDLDFHPDLKRKELWVVNMDNANTGGSTVTIRDAGTPNQTEDYRRDGNAWHFMSMPTSMAFGENGNWGTGPGVQDANHSGGTFTGPTLWSSDPSIYAIIGTPATAQFNGSHLDMLHGSPYGMGIAHEVDNVYWLWDTYYEDLVRYDFLEDHGPGQHYHGDGRVWRYTEIQAQRFNTRVPSHMIIDKNTGWLYVADARNSQVIRVNIYSGNVKNNLPLINEPLAEHQEMENVTVETVVSTGLTRPSGIDFVGNYLLVGDYETGEIIAYDMTSGTATEVGRIATGATELMGIKVGPDGHIWYVDAGENEVHKITAERSTVSINDIESNTLNYGPNPVVKGLSVKFSKAEGEVAIYSTTGQMLFNKQVTNLSEYLDLSSLASGAYLLEWVNDEGRYTERIIKR
jgi:hypothetical protein